MNTILRFLVDKYCDSHTWSPVTIQKDSPDWEGIAFWGIDKDISLVALIDGTVVGASTAGIEEDVLQIQWSFASSANISSETAILKSLIGQQLKVSSQRNIKQATFECDSTEEAMFRIPSELKVLKSETWRHFRYSPK